MFRRNVKLCKKHTVLLKLTLQFIELRNILISTVKTKFFCDTCYQPVQSFERQRFEIFLFKPTLSKELVAYPIERNMADANNNNSKYCACKWQLLFEKLGHKYVSTDDVHVI